MRTVIKQYDPESGYWAPLTGFLNEIGVDGDLLPPIIIAVERINYEYVEVFSPSQEVFALLSRLPLDSLYSLGLYMGMMKPGSWYKPGLPFAHRLAPHCGRVKCIVLDENGEKYFLYGRTVYAENTVSWTAGPALVVNLKGEALGWGVGKIANIGGRRRRVVEPIWDMGWYLRRGG